MIKRLLASFFLLILCISFLIGERSSFCQEEREEKEVLVIPYGVEINEDLLPAYEMSKESFATAFDPYMRYLEKRVGVKYEEKILSAEEMISHVRNGTIKIGFFRTVTYLKAHEELGFVPLVRVVIGTDTYKKVVLVRKDSGIKTVEELKGKRLICSSDRSELSYLFMRALLSKKKGVKDLNDFFGEIISPRVYRENSLILGVLLKEADVTCVDDWTFNVMCKLNPRIGKDLSILAQSEPFVNAPCAYSPDFIDEYGEETLLKLKEELLCTHQTPEGDQLLLTFKLRKFIDVRDSDYDSLRRMIKDIGIELKDLFE